MEALGSTWERAGKQVRSPTRPLVSGQSLPEEEQQRVLGEEKMLSINKKQATSPASKKPSQEGGKVRKGADGLGVGVGEVGLLPAPPRTRPSLSTYRGARRSPSGPCQPCSSSLKRSGGSCRRNGPSSRRAS